MRDAMIAGVTLNMFNNHSDRVRMACLAQTVNVLQAVILTNKNQLILTPTYHVMEMYNVHQDATLLPVKLTSPHYVYGTDSLTSVSASASIDSNGITHISLVNIDPHNAQTVSVEFKKAGFRSVTGRILTSPDIRDHNTFDEPQKIKPAIFKGATINGKNVIVKMPAVAVVVLELK